VRLRTTGLISVWVRVRALPPFAVDRAISLFDDVVHDVLRSGPCRVCLRVDVLCGELSVNELVNAQCFDIERSCNGASACKRCV